MTDRLRDIERAGGIQFLTGRGESVGFYRGPGGTLIVRALSGAFHLEAIDVPLTRVDMLSLQSFIAQVMTERGGAPPCPHPPIYVQPDGMCTYCGTQVRS